jgi:hypothetical protein
MTPGILILSCAAAMLFAFLVGYCRYAVVCGPDDWFDVPDEAAPWDALDKLILWLAVGSSCGISIGCIWALGAFIGRALL